VIRVNQRVTVRQNKTLGSTLKEVAVVDKLQEFSINPDAQFALKKAFEDAERQESMETNS
jgi:hypothetical protein